MKKCFKCGVMKKLADFYKHKKMKDGHLNKCKKCARIDVNLNRENKIEYYRDYDRKRGCRVDKAYTKKWRVLNKEKYNKT